MDPSKALAAVIIPTYNEVENIRALVGTIRSVDADLHVIIVDDNSPDGTGQLADELALADDKAHVIHRSGKLGLGTAYLAGFNQALAMGCDRVLTMDADFSHHPRYLPSLIRLTETRDVAIGSRYVPGGGVTGWGPSRIVLSRTANLVARTVLGLDAHDCTAGFRCYRRDVLKCIGLDSIRSSGYSFLVETLWRCERAGFRIGETPIVFEDRRRGKSKMSSAEIRGAMWTVYRLARAGWAKPRVSRATAAGLGSSGRSDCHE